MTIEHPLITFVLLAYNQEEYILGALHGAFAQTYPNLEILVSDDCSRDGTFGIIEEAARAYRGPHKLVCSRNDANLGIAGHINKINALARGELIVIAAGDDISLPARTQKIVDAYRASERTVHYFYSPAIAMDLDGKDHGVVRSPGARNADSRLRAGLSGYPLAVGATQAWSRRLIDAFGPLGPRVWAEDQILGFRGLLLGNAICIEEPLVRYRTGSGISTRARRFSIKKYLSGKLDGIWILAQRCADAWHARKYVLSGVIASKAVLMLLALPVSPLISAARKLRLA